MRKIFILLLALLQISALAFSQELLWKIGVHSFFDNEEYKDSPFQSSNTMSGIHLASQLGMSFKEKHRVFAGVDLMHESGSSNAIDYSSLIAYYEYDQKPFRFYMGAFPRKPLLDNYPRMFFQDSISNYRPMMNGFFWELHNKKDYMNIWLDWTGWKSYTRNEAFFMGWSGKYNWKALYGEHFGYMYHLAGTSNPNIMESVQDNGLILSSLGIDLSEKTGFENLNVNAGWSVGLERDRGSGLNWRKENGFLSEVKVEYKGLGLFNSFYVGDRQQMSYNKYENLLYWGDPVYRSRQYDRLDGYILFIKNRIVEIKFTYSFHFVEGEMYNAQSLYATFDLDNLKKKARKPYKCLWDNWFKNLKN